MHAESHSAQTLLRMRKKKYLAGRRILYDVFKDFVMWLSLKTLCSRVLSSIIDFLVTAAYLAP